jgi:hypothetical protein
MAKTNLMKALDPFEFRFTHPDDRKKYGNRWYVYDESAILQLPARDLIAIETDLDMSIPMMMNGFRRSTVLGDTAAAWYGVRAVDPALAGDFDEFNPIWAALEWRQVPKDQTAEAAQDDSLIESVSPDTTSAPMDTVALQVSPVAG